MNGNKDLNGGVLILWSIDFFYTINSRAFSYSRTSSAGS